MNKPKNRTLFNFHNKLSSNRQPETLKYLDEYLKSHNPDPDSSKKLKNGTPFSEVRFVVENFLKELIENNDFCRQVNDNESILSSIMAEHFKNQFETGMSQALLSFNSRKRVVNQVFGVPLKIIDNMLGKKIKTVAKNGKNVHIFKNGNKFEKYGYLTKNENAHTSLARYGNIKFIFKKNSLLGRTTMTFGDSLVNSRSIVASRVTNPKIESIPGVIENSYSSLKLLYGLITLNKVKSTDDAMDVIETYNRDAFKHISCSGAAYVELQFHGDLTKDDIAECYIPSTVDNNIKSIIKDNNIPVHTY